MKPVKSLAVHFASLVFCFDIAVPIDKEEGPGPLGGASCAPVRLNKHEKLIVFSFDGFRYDYMDKAPTPGLRALRANGVSTKYMNPVFPTKTLVNHQSFVTGLYAESHGIVDSSFEDPKYGPRTCDASGRGRFNSRFWNYEENVVPIWTLNEWAGDGRASGVAFPGANNPYGANKTLPRHFLKDVRHLSFQERVDVVLAWLTDAEHPANLIFMYFDEPDVSGHKFGPESVQVRHAIVRMDRVTRYLVDKLRSAGLFDYVNVMILSDHGMQVVENRINLRTLVNLTAGTHADVYRRFGHTPVLQIQPNEGNEDSVYDAFKDASIGRQFSVYRRSEIPERWHYSQSRRIMDILVVADPGFIFEDLRPSRKLSSAPASSGRKFGVHGYDNEAMSMKAFFLAHGPRFKPGFQAKPFSILDLFPLIAHLMGFGPAPNNGSLENVIAMLN